MGERGGKQIYEGEFVHAKEFSVVFSETRNAEKYIQKDTFKLCTCVLNKVQCSGWEAVFLEGLQKKKKNLSSEGGANSKGGTNKCSDSKEELNSLEASPKLKECFEKLT